MLDTNVLSDLMRPAPAPEVMAWFTGQGADQLNTSVINRAEILAGIALLPRGQRRDALAVAARAIYFQGCCLDFDRQATAPYAMLRAQRQRDRRPIDVADAQIALSPWLTG